MKIAEFAALPANLTGSFRAKESNVLDLDKHLTLRTYLDGYKLSEIDEKIWVGLASNRATVRFISKGKLVNLTRWFLYVEQAYPEMQKDIRRPRLLPPRTSRRQAQLVAAMTSSSKISIREWSPDSCPNSRDIFTSDIQRQYVIISISVVGY